jgi:hypothetical protein
LSPIVTGRACRTVSATALVLILAPAGSDAESVDTLFPLTAEEVVDGQPVVHKFAIGFWHLRSTSHTEVARPLKTARSLGCLRAAPGYKAKWVRFTTKLQNYGTNSTYIPVLQIGPDSTPECVRELAKGALDSLLNAE